MNRYRLVCMVSLIGLALTNGSSSASAEEAKEPQKGKNQQTEQQNKPASKLCPFCENALKENARYDEKVGNTLIRGAINFGFGWTEVITQPAREAQANGNIFAGMANGINRGVGRTFSGIGQMLTFWTPKIDGKYLHFIENCPLDVPAEPLHDK